MNVHYVQCTHIYLDMYYRAVVKSEKNSIGVQYMCAFKIKKTQPKNPELKEQEKTECLSMLKVLRVSHADFHPPFYTIRPTLHLLVPS